MTYLNNNLNITDIILHQYFTDSLKCIDHNYTCNITTIISQNNKTWVLKQYDINSLHNLFYELYDKLCHCKSGTEQIKVLANIIYEKNLVGEFYKVSKNYDTKRINIMKKIITMNQACE